MFCKQCQYDLRELPENRCPECGQPFNPDDPATYHRRAKAHPRWPLWLTCVGAGYPWLCVLMLYLTWVVAAISLGHRPRPYYVDDPKFIGSEVDLVRAATCLLFLASPVAMLLNALGLLMAAVVPRRRSFGFVFLLLCGSLCSWALSLSIVRFSKVTMWFFD
jgi:hypothetical protein